MRDITEQLMVVRFKQHKWYPRKYDRKASEEIARLHGITDASAAGRYNKILIDLDSIRPVERAMGKLYSQHFRMTSPWTDDGSRVLPTALYFDYTRALRDGRADIDREVAAFVAIYAQQREQARQRLLTLFNEDDYPPVEEIGRRFGIQVYFEPVPNPEDARCWGIGTAAAEEVERDVRASLEERFQNAQADVIKRVETAAREFVEKVQKFHNGDARTIYETAITNLADITGLVIRGLNVTGDAELRALAQELAGSISGLNIEQLRNSPTARITKSKEVDAIVGKFAGAFGGGS